MTQAPNRPSSQWASQFERMLTRAISDQQSLVTCQQTSSGSTNYLTSFIAETILRRGDHQLMRTAMSAQRHDEMLILDPMEKWFSGSKPIQPRSAIMIECLDQATTEWEVELYAFYRRLCTSGWQGLLVLVSSHPMSRSFSAWANICWTAPRWPNEDIEVLIRDQLSEAHQQPADMGELVSMSGGCPDRASRIATSVAAGTQFHSTSTHGRSTKASSLQEILESRRRGA